MRRLKDPYVVRFVRGDARGGGATMLRTALLPASFAFAVLAELRVALYRAGLFTSHRVPCPVVSVGNLTIGGTGKTPLVEWVVRESRLLGRNAVVLSRGYGASEDEVPDELAAMARNLGDFRYVRDPDRVRGALTAIEKLCADMVVLDDGFQHVRLSRQLDLLTIDATDPFGSGLCLPAGRLREPIRALRRAHGVVLTRADQVSRRALDKLRDRLVRIAPAAVLATAIHEPRWVMPIGGGPQHEPRWLEGRRVLAVSAIGNPRAFERTLSSIGARIADSIRLVDHYRYREEDLQEVARRAREKAADAVVTTQKDAMKWKNGLPDEPPCYVLGVTLRFESGEEALRDLLKDSLRGFIRRSAAS